MAKNYQGLWEGVVKTTDEGRAVRALAEILADKPGRVFLSRLGLKDAELCMEILDHVCHNSLSEVRSKTNLLGNRRVPSQRGRKE